MYVICCVLKTYITSEVCVCVCVCVRVCVLTSFALCAIVHFEDHFCHLTCVCVCV